MRKKFLTYIIISLVLMALITVFSVSLRNKKVLHSNVIVQQTMITDFASSAISASLENGLLAYMKVTMEGLASYAGFKLAIAYDSDLTPLLSIPPGSAINAAVEHEIRGMMASDLRSRLVSEGSVVYSISAILDAEGDTLGYFLLSFDNAAIEQEIANSIIYTALLAAALGLPIIIIISLQISHMIAPIVGVAETMKKLAAGDVIESLQYRAADEVGLLAESCNSMVEQIREKDRRLASYIEKVESARHDADEQRVLAEPRGIAVDQVAPLSQRVAKLGIGAKREDAAIDIHGGIVAHGAAVGGGDFVIGIAVGLQDLDDGGQHGGALAVCAAGWKTHHVACFS